jgi:hypothetical protein
MSTFSSSSSSGVFIAKRGAILLLQLKLCSVVINGGDWLVVWCRMIIENEWLGEKNSIITITFIIIICRLFLPFIIFM